jgi:hypothetical protein
MSRETQDAQVALQARQQIAYCEAKQRERAMISEAQIDADLQAQYDAEAAPRPVHSKLGASGAERWMNCHGSVALLKHLGLAHEDEQDWTREGTAMHEAAACGLLQGLEAWELVGMTFNNTRISAELANPVQVYLDYVRSLGDIQHVEYAISSPVHPLFYGQLDYGRVGVELSGQVVDVVDYKGGEGLPVEIENNPQLKYYAFGLIDGIERQTDHKFSPTTKVRLTIVQPRITWHPDGTVRTWETTVGAIKDWVHGILVPAMRATEFDDSLDAGSWCRFCPAKLVCPLLTAGFGAMALANPKHVEAMTPERLGLEYQAIKAVKHYITAVERQALAALMRREAVPGLKLVRKKANRAWKPGAPELARSRYGDKAFTKSELLSPAALSDAIPAAKDWVKEFAFTPDTGLTVALATEPGVAQTAPSAVERFSAALVDITGETDA